MTDDDKIPISRAQVVRAAMRSCEFSRTNYAAALTSAMAS
jgi:hypothetical protein